MIRWPLSFPFFALQLTCIAVVATPSSRVGAQGAVPVRALGAKLAEGSETFSQVRGFREMPDGRLVVTDQIEKKVVMLDLAKHSAIAIGRLGPGPGEYELPVELLPMGDTTLLGDARRGLSTFSVITPSGKLDGRVELPAGAMLTYVYGADARGHIYVPVLRTMPGTASAADSAPVLRVDVRHRTMDTALFVRPIPSTPGMPRNPYNPRHQWAVGADGRIALVDVEAYRVTWISPTGQRKVGQPISYDRIPVTERDVDTFRDLARRYGELGVSGGGVNGARGAVALGFPDFKPPYFGNNALQIAPNNELWVRRSQRVGETRALHDIVDGDGKRIATILLPPNTKLLLLGVHGVYLARYDEDDVIHIERYAYPPA